MREVAFGDFRRQGLHLDGDLLRPGETDQFAGELGLLGKDGRGLGREHQKQQADEQAVGRMVWAGVELVMAMVVCPTAGGSRRDVTAFSAGRLPFDLMIGVIYTLQTAKVFFTGHSQAVRLPLEFRFEDKEVSIRKDAEAIVLEPIKKSRWPRGFWKRIHIADQYFERPSQGRPDERRSLDGSS
jgi:virulence-associated protein VagC